jgi:hypothetical protein
MPGQRAKNKVILGGYVDRELHREIVRLARLEGMAHDRFGFVKKLILEAVDGRKAKPETKPKGSKARK